MRGANDPIAKERQLAPQERLRYHQEASQPTMQELRGWLTRQLDEKPAEPNSALGGAINYMLKHWDQFGCLFMSLVHTCELNGANPFDYLTELRQHGDELAARPERWTPWNYRDAEPT